MPTTNQEYDVNNPIGSMVSIIETMVGLGLANEYHRLLDQGLSSSQATSTIKASPAYLGASKMFGAIGLAAGALASVHDAVTNGGSLRDYTKAAESFLVA